MSKHGNKRLTRDELVARNIVFIGFAIAFPMSITISINLKTSNGVAIFFAVFIPLSAILLILFLILNSAKIKGNLGERRVSKILRRIQKEYGGYVFLNCVSDNTSYPRYLSDCNIGMIQSDNLCFLHSINHPFLPPPHRRKYKPSGSIFEYRYSEKWLTFRLSKTEVLSFEIK